MEFGLLTAFNILTAVVMTSVEEARRESPGARGSTGGMSEERALLLDQVDDLGSSLKAMEGRLVRRKIGFLRRRDEPRASWSPRENCTASSV